MNKLDKYIKVKPTTKGHISSVNLRPDQHEFIKARGLNLSEIVRDVIDDLIQSTQPRKAK